ncbi:hypothetical protein AGLY_015918 [Aphis glycines]|uniref:Uncharacterized protein n=1 Tax=Aphis glycines TaxID=307491 RepID=A0A6G0SZ76_APHGL|nr:hypothetical protein AGLY_015918 [Aphis glycines]
MKLLILCLTKWLFDNILNFVIQSIMAELILATIWIIKQKNAWCYGSIYKSGLELPIGYFLTSNLKSMQKAELIKQALSLLKATRIGGWTGVKRLSLQSDQGALRVDLPIIKFKDKANCCNLYASIFLSIVVRSESSRNVFSELKFFGFKQMQSLISILNPSVNEILGHSSVTNKSY